MRTVTTILALLGTLVMFLSGLVKVISSSFRADQSEIYELAGSQIPAWFFLLTGIFEIVVALLILLPRTRVLGGLGLLVTMIGALGFNLGLASDTATDPDPATFAPINIVLAVLGLLIALLWMRVRRSDAKSKAAKPA